MTITLTPKTISSKKVYVAIATINLLNKYFATGTTNQEALTNIIKLIK